MLVSVHKYQHSHANETIMKDSGQQQEYRDLHLLHAET
jgi:hypothetical protein